MEIEATEKNKIIMQLESEKKKIEEDVQNLRLETERRKLARSGINQVSMSESVTQKVCSDRQSSKSHHLTSKVSNDVKKGEWMRISVLIKEANAISVGLHKVCLS